MPPGILRKLIVLYVLLNRVDRRIRVTGRHFAWSPWWLVFGMVLMMMLSAMLAVIRLPMNDSGLLVLDWRMREL